MKMKQERKMSIANLITSTRIVGSIGMLFTKPLSISFFVIYTLCGISDAIDGWVARATKSTSEFGAKLDSIADLLFYSVMALKIFPILLKELPVVLWFVAGSVIFVRIISYLLAAIKYRRFASLHTYLNKATGLAIFAIPYFIVNAGTTLICSIVGVISGMASVEELLIHVCSKSYPPNTKTILNVRKNADAGA